MNIIRNNNIIILQREAANRVNAVLQKNREKPIFLLLSGGSALTLLLHFDAALLKKRATISVLDERWSDNLSVNNFAQILKTPFYEKAKTAGARFIDTRVQKRESLNECAERLDRTFKEWREKNPEGVIIATQGIGADGHTAGILPYPENPALFQELFENQNKWVVGYDAKEKNPYPLRATVTLPFLREEIDIAVVYITGEEKRAAFEKIMAREGMCAETPARILREMKEVFLYTTFQ